jgi:hypothetical protein
MPWVGAQLRRELTSSNRTSWGLTGGEGDFPAVHEMDATSQYGYKGAAPQAGHQSFFGGGCLGGLPISSSVLGNLMLSTFVNGQ